MAPEGSKYTAGRYGQIHEERSNLPVAPEVAEFDEQLKQDPTNAELWFKRSVALKDFQMACREAIESVAMCLTYDPFHAKGHRFRGHYYINVGKYQEGCADLELSSRLDPADWDTWYHLGVGYFLMQDYGRAARCFERCIELDDGKDVPADLDWYWMCLIKLGDKAKADYALRNITLDSKPIVSVGTFGNVYDDSDYLYRLQMYKGLISPDDLYRKCQEYTGYHFCGMAYGIAFYYEYIGNLEKAMEIYEAIAACSEENWGLFAVHAALVRLGRTR